MHLKLITGKNNIEDKGEEKRDLLGYTFPVLIIQIGNKKLITEISSKAIFDGEFLVKEIKKTKKKFNKKFNINC